jgi:predicted 3-demethylubiquinone-9 3-methyltransferase (glyoxalase superfamily)
MVESKQTIVPHLWFDEEAREAAEFYCGVFGASGSGITDVTTLRGTPSGETEIVSFELAGHPFMAIGAGPGFRFNPSVSFFVNFDPLDHGGANEAGRAKAEQHLEAVWGQLADGGEVLMPLGAYPFSERYGWVQDRFGLSWQLILTDPAGEPRPFIFPALLFTGPVSGKAEEATEFYLSVFGNSRRGELARYPAGMEPDEEGTIMYTDVMLEGCWFAAMDSAREHGFRFNEAISFMVYCDTQAEIDGYWEALSAVPGAEQCGWLKDRYGLSWQVVPRVMDEMMRRGTQEQVDRLTQAFLPMKKLEIRKLEEAFEGAAGGEAGLQI